MTVEQFETRYPSPKRPKEWPYIASGICGTIISVVIAVAIESYFNSQLLPVALSSVVIAGGGAWFSMRYAMSCLAKQNKAWVKRYNRYLHKRIKCLYPNMPYTFSDHS